MNGFEARERAAEAPYEEQARGLYDTYRKAGAAYWGELSQYERDQWLRVARHVAERIGAAEDRGTAAAE